MSPTARDPQWKFLLTRTRYGIFETTKLVLTSPFLLSQKCALLDGLDINLVDDRAAVDAFRERMTTIVGNLEKVHEHLEELTCPELEKTALLNVDLQCWLHEDETSGVEFRVYELAGHTIVS